MVTVTIEGKEYNFVFNANTSELFYQVFNEDLFDITLKMKEDNTLIMKRNRLQKLAFIANMQSKKPIRELAGRLSLVQYFEWSEQFAGGTFMQADVIKDLVTAWSGTFETTAEEKNPDSQQ